MFKAKFNIKEDYNTPPFKDKYRKWRTTSLFFETHDRFDTPNLFPLYALGEEDIVLAKDAKLYGLITKDLYSYLPEELRPLEDNRMPSLRGLYLAIEDPKEQIFAKTVFGSWYHWKHLLATDWFKPYIEEYREALDAQLMGSAFQVILGVAQGADAKLALAAAKWIADQGYKQKQGKGRPTAREVADNLKKESLIQSIYDEDLKRLGIN